MPALTLAALQDLVGQAVGGETALLLPADEGPKLSDDDSCDYRREIGVGFFEAAGAGIPFKISKYKWTSPSDVAMELEVTGFFYPGSAAPAATGDDPEWTDPGDADDWEIDTAKNLLDNQPLSDEDLENFSNDEATTPRFAKVLYKLLPQSEDVEESKVQTLIFDKDYFSQGEAESWAKSHDFTVSKVDEKDETYRIRQENPDKFPRMRTIQFGPGIKAVVGFAKGEKREQLEGNQPVALTHDNFDDAFARAKDGKSVIWVRTMTHASPINAKTIKKFEASGHTVLKKSKDGKGFIIQNGSRKDYVFPGQVHEVINESVCESKEQFERFDGSVFNTAEAGQITAEWKAALDGMRTLRHTLTVLSVKNLKDKQRESKAAKAIKSIDKIMDSWVALHTKGGALII